MTKTSATLGSACFSAAMRALVMLMGSLAKKLSRYEKVRFETYAKIRSTPKETLMGVLS